MKLSVFDYLFIFLPQCLFYILGGYAVARIRVTKQKFNSNNTYFLNKYPVAAYIFSSVILAAIGFTVKLMPVDFGIPQAIELLACITLLVTINRISVLKAIIASFGVMILEVICEIANMLILSVTLNMDPSKLLSSSSPLTRIISGLPSFFIFAAASLVFYFFMVSKRSKIETPVIRKVWSQ